MMILFSWCCLFGGSGGGGEYFSWCVFTLAVSAFRVILLITPFYATIINILNCCKKTFHVEIVCLSSIKQLEIYVSIQGCTSVNFHI